MSNYQITIIAYSTLNVNIPEYIIAEIDYNNGVIIQIYLLNSNVPTYKLVVSDTSGQNPKSYFVNIQYNFPCLETIKLNIPLQPNTNDYITYFTLPNICIGANAVLTISAVY